MTRYNPMRGSFMSLIIGTPLGILALVFSALLLMNLEPNENVIYLMMPLFYCSQIMLISFLLVLWRSGRNAANNLIKGEQRLWVVIKYSTTISLVMGGVFSCVFIVCWSFIPFFFFIGGIFMFGRLLLPILIIFASTFVVAFIIGLLVCYVIKWQISRIQPSVTDPEIR